MKWEYRTLESLVEDQDEIPLDNRQELAQLFKAQEETADRFTAISDEIQKIRRPEPEQFAGGYLHRADRDQDVWNPITFLGLVVETAGFEYSPTQDIILSTMYNFQRLLGYCQFYDESAFLICSRLDCEVIKFEYDSYEWMIELWKGQYGIETGGEIGVYRRQLNTPLSKIEKETTGPLYNCIPDNARLPMSFELYNSKDNIDFPLNRQETHWWLTGFHWGLFSSPENLTLIPTITFPNKEMTDAFTTAVEKLGYMGGSITVENTSVSFVFDKPFSPQPQTQVLFGAPVQILNKIAVALYNYLKTKLGITCNDPNVIWQALQESTDALICKSINKMSTYLEINYKNRLVLK